MRVLICDQESEMLETVSRWFDVDTATSKATCVDLMRANPFDVVIASERLSDGSGLELLSHITARWPETLRVLVIEPARLKLLRGKLAPFRLHATMRYPIEEDELETVLNRMGELMSAPEVEEEAEEEPAPAPAPAPPPVLAPQAATKTQKTSSLQEPGPPSSANAKGGSVAPVPPRTPNQMPSTGAPKPSSRTAKAALPLGSPKPTEPPTVKRKLGNYTPLGAPGDDTPRIVEREFDRTIAPLAARAMRQREEAERPRTQKEKLGTLTTHLTDRLKNLLKR
jgi:DNA-binding NarL/FixJ family response regulator